MWPLFKFINFFYLLVSSNAWFYFMLPTNYMPIIVAVFMVICYCFGDFRAQLSPNVIILFALVGILGLYGNYIINPIFGAWFMTSVIPAVLIYMLDKEHQEDLLKYITKWYAIIIGIGAVLFLATNFVNLPHFMYNMGDYGVRENYIFFTKIAYAWDITVNSDVTRFCGPFLEPGHIANISALLLFANRFKFKGNIYMWIILVSVFISYSLAGYVILAIGFVMLKVRNVFSMAGIVAAFLGFYVFFAEIYHEGNNPVNVLILKRLEFDDEKGIKGNNRTGVKTDYFYRQCVRDGRVWLGVRSLKDYGRSLEGAGYKVFFMKYGILAAILWGLIYIYLINPKANKRYAWSFFVLICILFLQRAYPYWYAWLLSYTLGIGVTRNELLFNKPEEEEEEDEKSEETPIAP